MSRKKTKSHRQSLRVKYMVNTKAKAQRKKTAKLLKQAPNSAKKSSKDPGIPNLWPYKEDLCRQLAKKKEDEADEQARQREMKKRESEKRRQMLERAVQMQVESVVSQCPAKGEDMGTGNARSWYQKELRRVVESADVILMVLDARDPMGCRSIDLEQKIASGQMSPSSPSPKRIVFVLNKIDLVPRDVAEGWLAYLRQSFPTIAFKASTQNQKSHLAASKGRAESANDNRIGSSGCLGADALLQLLKNYSRNQNLKTSLVVGLIGYPNTGKSSIINSLKRSRAVSTGSTPGLTKTIQEVHLDGKIKLLDSPGVIFDNVESACLRNAFKVESIEDPIGAVESILARFPAQELMAIYEIARFNDAHEFLMRIAHKRGKLKKGGVPDMEQAARLVLHDWNSGAIPYYVAPPAVQTIQCEAPKIVDEFGKVLELDALVKEAPEMQKIFVAIESEPLKRTRNDNNDEMEDDNDDDAYDFKEFSE